MFRAKKATTLLLLSMAVLSVPTVYARRAGPDHGGGGGRRRPARPMNPSTSPQQFTRCASENQYCSFQGTATVYYGANGSWASQQHTNGVACNNQVFGDPLRGTVKACFVLNQAPPPPPTPPTPPLVQGPTPANSPQQFTHCANENQHCRFQGTATVYYGANGAWTAQQHTNGVACSNQVFGDPLYGTVKACYVLTPPPPPPPSTGGLDITPGNAPQLFARCAGENGQCRFNGARTVFYGANGSWVTRVVTNGVACTNQVFGDPLHGTVKACYIMTQPPPDARQCATENGQCRYRGTRTVYYGANNAWVSMAFQGGTPCTNQVFGDPLYGTVKACYVR